MNKIIYLGTTPGCSACKCMEAILKNVKEELPIFNLEISRFNELPDFIKINVPIGDFPITILVVDDVIKYHFSGTKPHRFIKGLLTQF